MQGLATTTSCSSSRISAVTSISDLKAGMRVLLHPDVDMGEEACTKSGTQWNAYASYGVGKPCYVHNVSHSDQSVQIQTIEAKTIGDRYSVYYTIVRPLSEEESA
jgi:hypothetical protein